LNSCFLRPTGVHHPNGKSIGSAISAQLTAESPYTLQWATFFPKLPFPWEDLDLHRTRDSLGPSELTTQRHVDPRGIWTPSNAWYPGPTRVVNPNGISIRSAVFARLTSVTDRPIDRQTDGQTDRRTDHATRSVTVDRIYIHSTEMRSKE